MKEKKLILGGEPSGHIILNNYASTGDGILASLEVLGIMKFENKKLSSLANLYVPFPQIMQNYPIKSKQDTKSSFVKSGQNLSINIISAYAI